MVSFLFLYKDVLQGVIQNLESLFKDTILLWNYFYNMFMNLNYLKPTPLHTNSMDALYGSMKTTE